MTDGVRRPIAVRPSVEPAAFALTESAVISPLKSDTEAASPLARAIAREPTSLVAELVIAPVFATDPSSGYAKPAPNETL